MAGDLPRGRCTILERVKASQLRGYGQQTNGKKDSIATSAAEAVGEVNASLQG